MRRKQEQESVLVEEDVTGVGEEVDMVKAEVSVEKAVAKPEKAEKGSELEQLPGVGAATAEKLVLGGYDTLLSVAVATPGELVELTGVTELAARKMIQFARDKLEMGFVSAEDVLVKRQGIGKINSGSSALDNLLGGGFETGAISECFGAYGSGKCVAKDTKVIYFNTSKPHFERVEDVYNKYVAINGEKPLDTGYAVEVPQIEVMGLTDRGLVRTGASLIYKEKVDKLIELRTKRGRVIRITLPHKLLSFSDGLVWQPAATLQEGAVIAYPKEMFARAECGLTADDAYFLGLFVAEGTSNPLSLSTSSEELKEWVIRYIESRFSYVPTVRKDSRRETPVYEILLRQSSAGLLGRLSSSNSASKFVPEEIFGADESVTAAFLAGYMDGDGHYAPDYAEATTKSKELASGLSYLFAKLGMALTVREKPVNAKTFYRLSIVGDDRSKLAKLISKIKTFSYTPNNSSYGYPKQFIDYIKKMYRETLFGNRGRTGKSLGRKNNGDDIFYHYLTRVNAPADIMNEKTMERTREAFLNGLKDLLAVREALSNLENLPHEEFVKAINSLPFAFNSIATTVGLTKSGIGNYMVKGVAPLELGAVKKALLGEVEKRAAKLELALKTIKNFVYLNWDSVEQIQEIDYNDYVYDFVVPEGHSFVGGEMPTIMHNTQVAHSLAVNTIRQFPNSYVVYLDTESTFRPERIIDIAKAQSLEPEKVLKQIKVARCFNSDHQMLLAEKIDDLIKNQGLNVKLVVVDSLTAHFRAEFIGRGTLADRQQKINKHMHTLMRLAELNNLCVYVTNQVMAKPDVFFGDPTEAIGGHIVGHACLTGDSLIQLADGSLIEIERLQEEKVVCADFNDMSVCKSNSEKVFVNPDVKKIYNIKTNCQINCSELHRFFSIDNFNIIEKEAKELKEGDFIAQVGKLDIEGEERPIPEFKIRRIGKLSDESADFVKSKFVVQNVSRKEACSKIGITPRQLRRVLNQEYPASFDVLSNLQSYFGEGQMLEFVPVFTNKHRNILVPQHLTPQLAQIFGYFWGDGNLEKRGLRFRDARIGVLNCYNKYFNELFNLSGAVTKVKGKNCFSLNINSSEVRELFRFMLPNILNEVARSKRDVVNAFVRGFVDGEGHISKKRAHITIAQKKSLVLRYIQMFLLRSGIRSTIKFGIGRKGINVLRITDKDVIKYLQIGFTAEDKQTRLIECINSIRKTYSYEVMPVKRRELAGLMEACRLKPYSVIRSRPDYYEWVSRKELAVAYKALMNCRITDRQLRQKIEFISGLLNSDIRFEKIREIKISDNNSKLYDFSVPDAENYMANGFIVHNSTYRVYLRRGKKGTRVAKMIDSPSLPEGEATFVLDTSGVRDV